MNFKAVVDSDVVVAIANEADFSNTAEGIQSMQSTAGEVSDKELEGAAGGRRSRENTLDRLFVRCGE